MGKVITQAVVLKFIWGFLEYFFFLSRRVYRRIQDKGCRNCANYASKTTKKKHLQQYIDTHSGPEFSVQFKYSFVLCMVFVAFVYAPGLPFLFPLTLFWLCIFYCVDRVLITYSMKKPPHFDAKMNEDSLRQLVMAPLCYLANGFWMYSNQQLFKNNVLPKATIDGVSDSNHELLQWP